MRDVEKTSVAMGLCVPEKCWLGGDEEGPNVVARNELLLRLEGLVLFGLGPPAISQMGLCSMALLSGYADETKKLVVASSRRASEQICARPEVKRDAECYLDMQRKKGVESDAGGKTTSKRRYAGKSVGGENGGKFGRARRVIGAQR